MKIYRCRYCKYNIADTKNSKGAKGAKYKMGYHYEINHKNLIPADMDGWRYFYYLITKKENGSCVECKQPTAFNTLSMKYSRFCDNPMCKQKYKEERDRRMMSKYGKIHLLDDPEIQKKMQERRKIAGIYNWSDNITKIAYLGSYEEDFLKYLDKILKWKPSDIMASPHIYVYEYEGKNHYYMPDFFIPSMNLEIEIKDDGSALYKSQDVRDKDIIKENLMKSLSNLFNYIKIVNKNYDEFERMVREV